MHEAYRSANRTWAAVSGRVHAVFYNTDLLDADDLPDTLDGFADPAWRGRITLDPTADPCWRPSTRSARSGARTRPEPGSRACRQTIRRCSRVPFGAREIINVVAGGELAEVGFGSHYYLYDMQADGEAMNATAKLYPGDPADLLSVDGVGIINGTDNRPRGSGHLDASHLPAATAPPAPWSLAISHQTPESATRTAAAA